jgi:hypothetical protein
MVEYPPIQLPDYRSPYAARTYKPYRQRKFNNEPLPIINHSHSDRKGRPALYEPRYRVEKHHPYNSTKQTSLVIKIFASFSFEEEKNHSFLFI